jgi:hypothetical protein
MRVTLHSTSKVVTLTTDGGQVPARIWEGVTAGGIRCHAYVTRIACAQDADSREFETDLQEHAPPSAEIAAFPLRDDSLIDRGRRMQPYAEMMKELCKPLAKTPASLLEAVAVTIHESRAAKHSPVFVLLRVRDRLATTYQIGAVDDFILAAVLMVVSTELENRRLESERCGR